MANNVRVTELDFDTIKENLKTYLRAQSQFTDYDFDASNLSVLMDLLAYNTHYNAVLANMVSNEMFLDTAIKRSSVVSLAKQINYVPRSIRSASAEINIAISNPTSSPNFITLDKYTAFNTSIDGETYTFYNVESYSTTPSSGVYTFSNVKIYQGRKLDYYFVVNTPGPNEKYVIPNQDIDTTTLQVSIQNSTGTSETYIPVTDISLVDDTSKVYYLQENTEGFYEIFFGDDVLGRKLATGDIVKVTYLISDGAAANVSTEIAVAWTTNSIAGEVSGDRSITTVIKPSGGSSAESAEQIRFRSINSYAAQNRAVTKTDYATIISSEIPGAQSVNVWGGENNDPPEYGKTFISIKPKTGYVLTDLEKTNIIENVLQKKSMVSAQHEFVDPTYTYVLFDVQIKFTTAQTNKTASQIKSLANDKIVEFMNTNLDQFNTTFYRSQLEEQLMDLDDSILSVNVIFTLSKVFPLIPNIRLSNVSTFKLPSSIHPNGLRSTYFYYTDENGVHAATLRDVPDQTPPDYNGTGIIQTVDLSDGTILDSLVANVNYGTGVITLNSESPLTISGYLGNISAIYVYVEPQEGTANIVPAFNEILTLDTNNADVVSALRNGINIEVEAVNS